MYMFKYVLKRLGLVIFTFAVIMLICFTLIKLLPITVPRQQGVDANIGYFRLEQRGYITNLVYRNGLVVGFDRVPILVQLWYYVKRIVTQGDFGIGTTLAAYALKPVWGTFVEKLPPTVLINL